MPVYLGDTKETVHFEQLISEMTLNSGLALLQDKGKLVFSYFFTSKFLTKVIPNFVEVFGKKDKVVVRFETTSTPILNVLTEGSSLSANLRITIVNPYNPDYEAVIIEGDVAAWIEF